MPATPDQCRRYRQNLKLRASALVGDKCAACGTAEKLEFAHTNGTGLSGDSRGLTRRMIDVVRNPGCYTRLCVSCHHDYDCGIIVIKRFSERVVSVSYGVDNG